MPSCSLQNQDPDQGITSRGCICSSTTLPLLTAKSATDQSQSCHYIATPTKSVPNPISVPTSTSTSNSRPTPSLAALLTAQLASISSCAPTSSFAVMLSNNKFSLGDDNYRPDGLDLQTDLYNKLKALCGDTDHACDLSTPTVIDKGPTLVGSDVTSEKLSFTIWESRYESTMDRDRMLASAVATWQQAAAKSYQGLPYTIEGPDKQCSSDPAGPVRRRDLWTMTGTKLNRRINLPDGGSTESECHYTANLCSTPDHVC